MNSGRGLGLLVGFVVGGAIACSGDCALAQSKITPDNTLGSESSTVVPNYQGLPVEAIAGGAVRGGNLFHSFLEFNVSAGRGAYFYSPNASIQNILARVTGSNASQILGTLGTFGNSKPNLFLINPNGITFGANASLNVGGSFVATTANAVQLGDKGLFSASEPATSNLLSINPSAFFFNSLSHGAIVNSSTATSTVLNTSTLGLQVPDGQSLLLVGGDINLDGGSLGVVGGRVELGGLAETGTVGLTVNGNNLSLSFSDNVARSDVMLTNGALVGATGDKGSIAVTTRNLNMLGGSTIRAGIGVGGTADSKAGNIEVDAQGAVNLKDGSLTYNTVRSGAVGQSGDVRINTGSLSLTNGAQLFASTFGKGNGGNVIIHAGDTISFDGFPSGAFSDVEQGAVGNGGNIEIATSSLSLTSGALLVATTRSRGDAGNVIIQARDSVSFDGANSNGSPSGAISTVEKGAVGEGGNVEITTGSLSLTRGGLVTSGTRGQGDAGNVIIQARDSVSFDGVNSNQNGATSAAFSTVEQGAVGKGGNVEITTSGSLRLTNGAQLLATTRGQGDAGNVIIQARDSVSFDGVDSNVYPSGAFSNVEQGAVGKGGNVEITTGFLSLTNGAQLVASTKGQGDAGNVIIQARDAVSFDGIGPNGAASSGAFSNAENGAAGKGGDVNITADSLSITNGASVDVTSLSQDIAGNVEVKARSVLLDGGTIEATTAASNGGNITLQIGDLLLLRHGSLISTTAGTAQAGGDGGNITIATPFIVAVPKENSDITANAYTGKGGNIQITTQGIFGTQYRPHLTPLSDITASSQFGVNGTVQINTPGVDPSRGLTDLATAPVDTSKQIAQNCPARGRRQGSSFIITGTGGLPPRPGDPFLSPYATGTVRAIPTSNSSNEAPSSLASETDTSPHPDRPPATPTIVEAQGWVYGPHGEVILTATAPTLTPQNAGVKPPTCPQS